MTKKLIARLIDKRKKKGQFPWFPLGKTKRIGWVQLDENSLREPGRNQPDRRGLIKYDDGREESIHLWPSPNREGFDGEVRVAR